ncbi:GNAT family N-acetyltransferase [Limnoglobus roseus]|uniref:GNAT family N-acetyltransferase n=1 Tax=Limnoglobus roseus TaxID=2598579 RepID=A0A5C1A835_9BACT|nr:GNAT family N-acetyltransferase [Limnoglobus roseus]QEL14343.1 GNAT family N-acetyltransferase [Limnoglobus roseus]
MIEIRPIQDADYAPLLAIINEVIERGDAFYFDVPFTPDGLRDYVRSFTAAFVAVLEGRVVGGYVLRPNHPGRGSHVANGTYMVDANTRGHGVGKLLGEHSLAEAKRLGFSAMQFNAVVSTNTGAVELWRKLGFAIIGTVPQGFRHADGRFVNLHILHRDLGERGA